MDKYKERSFCLQTLFHKSKLSKNKANSHYSWQLRSIKSLQTLVSEYRIIAPKRNTELGSCQPRVITVSSTDKYTTLFYVCFCQKTPYLIHNVDSLALTPSQQLWKACLSEVCLTQVYSLEGTPWPSHTQECQTAFQYRVWGQFKYCHHQQKAPQQRTTWH